MTMKIISTLLLVFLITITNATKSEFKFDDYKLHISDNIFAQMKTNSQLKSKTSLRAGAASLLEVKTKQAPYPYYHLIARHSSMCMALDTVGLLNINQIPCGALSNQKFMFLQTTFLTYIIMVLFSGEVLEEFGTSDGDTLEQKPLGGSTMQQFDVTLVPGTCYYTLKNKGSGKCIEVVGSSMLPTADVQQVI